MKIGSGIAPAPNFAEFRRAEVVSVPTVELSLLNNPYYLYLITFLFSGGKVGEMMRIPSCENFTILIFCSIVFLLA